MCFLVEVLKQFEETKLVPRMLLLDALVIAFNPCFLRHVTNER